MKVLERKSIVAAVGVALVQLACGGGGDGVTAPPEQRVPTSITATTSTSLTATAGDAISPTPAVVVKDQHEQPMTGITVTFAITAGGGTLTGETALTNSSGVATVGSWTLGKTSGVNSLAAKVGQLTPVTFTANGNPGAPASFAKTAGDNQTAVAGSGLTIAPSITLTDANGNGVPGVAVTFAITSGGGTVIGGNATSNTAGVAAPTEWILGKTPGPNSLTATVANLGAVTFAATAIVGPPASLSKFVGDNQTAAGGYPVYMPPGVVVLDAQGNPVSGATVSFAAAAGDGSVVGATQTSDASGKASVGSWVLGAVGANTLVASVGSVTTSFSATATDPCQYFLPFVNPNGSASPVSSSGSLAVHDCRGAGGAYQDQFLAPILQVDEIRLSSSSFDPLLSISTDYGLPVAENDDASSTDHNSYIKVISKGGVEGTHLYVTSSQSGALGDYTLTKNYVSEDVRNCEKVFITRHLTANENLEATDCSGASYYDKFLLYLRSGESVFIDMTSSVFAKKLELLDPDGNVVATSVGTTSINYVPTNSGYYVIRAGSVSAGATGRYDLQIR